MPSPGEGEDVDAFCLLSLVLVEESKVLPSVVGLGVVVVVVTLTVKVLANVGGLNLKCSDAEKPHDLGIHSSFVSVEDFVYRSNMLRKSLKNDGDG